MNSTNKRMHAYGGSLRNRLRLPVSVDRDSPPVVQQRAREVCRNRGTVEA
jgi:2,4-dienoyl-CoA reductase-like NADH-dependent reductase (Old Yellow Enzyme family)